MQQPTGTDRYNMELPLLQQSRRPSQLPQLRLAMGACVYQLATAQATMAPADKLAAHPARRSHSRWPTMLSAMGTRKKETTRGTTRERSTFTIDIAASAPLARARFACACVHV